MDEVMKRRSRKSNMRKLIEQNGDILIRFGILILFIVVVVVVSCLIVRHKTIVKMEKVFEQRIEEVKAETEAETTERLRAVYGADEKDEKTTNMIVEANEIAKVLYAYRWNSDEGLRSAVWCVLNRVDSRLYPDTVKGVCSQDKQWMGWSDDNPVIQHLSDIAFEELKLWHSGVHSVGPEFLFLEWTSSEITLRTTFEGGRGCHYWYESDWR